MKVAMAKGRLRGKQPKLKPAQEAHLVELWRVGKHTSAELSCSPSLAPLSTGPCRGPARRSRRTHRLATHLGAAFSGDSP
jgi:hypothetical protein